MNEEVYRINQESDTRDLIKFQICGTTFPDKSYRISRPSSPLFCIEYIESGCGTVHIDGEVFYPKAGDSYLLQSSKSQYYYSDKDNPWKKHFVNVSGKLVEHLCQGYGLSNVSYFQGLSIEKELRLIIDLAKDEKNYHTNDLIAVLNTIFFKMREHILSRESRFDVGTQMKDFLNTQITSKFQIEQLCKHVSKSESQTIRIFKKNFGVTPYTYVLDQKISFAKKLLANTSLSVKEISDKLCFADEYYFSNFFKNKTGYTPTQYRKREDK